MLRNTILLCFFRGSGPPAPPPPLDPRMGDIWAAKESTFLGQASNFVCASDLNLAVRVCQSVACVDPEGGGGGGQKVRTP